MAEFHAGISYLGTSPNYKDLTQTVQRYPMPPTVGRSPTTRLTTRLVTVVSVWDQYCKTIFAVIELP